MRHVSGCNARCRPREQQHWFLGQTAGTRRGIIDFDHDSTASRPTSPFVILRRLTKENRVTSEEWHWTIADTFRRSRRKQKQTIERAVAVERSLATPPGSPRSRQSCDRATNAHAPSPYHDDRSRSLSLSWTIKLLPFSDTSVDDVQSPHSTSLFSCNPGLPASFWARAVDLPDLAALLVPSTAR
ncbi:hypothetical protein VTN96DRAFT_789 [Rasamsonia emersonii]